MQNMLSGILESQLFNFHDMSSLRFLLQAELQFAACDPKRMISSPDHGAAASPWL